MSKTYHRKWSEQDFSSYDKKRKFSERRIKRRKVLSEKQKVMEIYSYVPEHDDEGEESANL
jgi:hypothetical protein